MSRWLARCEPGWDLAAWRELARHGWEAAIPPDHIDWDADAQPGLIPAPALQQASSRRKGPSVPAAFVGLAATVLCHRDPQRHALLYRLLWRIGNGERQLLERVTDADVHRALQWSKAVQRDTHKMKAFVRFRAVAGLEETYVAWFEPGHWIVDRVAPFFMRRFAGMRWTLLTPYRSARWDGERLWAGPGGQRDQAPSEDANEALWQTYYANIFNPARLNPTMMRQEMPQKYWHLLPEAQLLPGLIREAGARVRAMAERDAQPPRRRIPPRRTE